MSKLLSEQELEDKLVNIVHGWIGDCGLDVQDVRPFVKRELLPFIHSQKIAHGDMVINSISSSIGNYPDDIGNFHGELRGKWEERRRSQNIVAEQKGRNV